MSLNNTYFETKGRDITNPIPEQPSYIPPIVPTPPTPGSGSTPVIPRPTYSGNISVVLYNNASDDDTLDKNITQVDSILCTIKEEVDILHFRIPLNRILTNVNYAAVDGRYYFCKIIKDAGNITWLQFDIDPLMSFKDQIKGLSGIIERTGNNYNTYLNDPEVKITSWNNVYCKQSSQGFSNTNHYYLLTIGDKGGVQ